MLDGLLSSLTKPVPPVPPEKNQREPLEDPDLLAVPSVPPVPPEKTEINIFTESEQKNILAWLSHIGETDQAIIDDVLDYCASNPEALSYYLKRAEEVPLPDDRHHCRECRNLNSRGYCIRQRFRPVDDLPRRCEDFNDSRIQQ